MMRQTTTKAPELSRKSCIAQGATRRGLHASRLGSNGHHCKVSIFVGRPCNKIIVVCKFTISKAVRPGLALPSSVVPRFQIFSHHPRDGGFTRKSSLGVPASLQWLTQSQTVDFGHLVTIVTAGAELQQVHRLPHAAPLLTPSSCSFQLGSNANKLVEAKARAETIFSSPLRITTELKHLKH